MDTAIAIFAILSGLEARYRRIAGKDRLIEKPFEEELGSLLKKNKSSWIDEMIDEIIDETKENILREHVKDIAEKFNPVIGLKFWIMFIMFISGIILEILGIFFD
jgi:hypothetical protein